MLKLLEMKIYALQLLLLPIFSAVHADITQTGTAASQEILPLVKAQDIKSSIAHEDLHDVHLQAEMGSIEAFYILGLYYLYGNSDVDPDEKAALNWFRKAASGGHNDARCATGLLLLNGSKSIKVDRAEAKSYFRLASNADHLYGHYLLGRTLFEEASQLKMASGATQIVSDDTLYSEAASLLQPVVDEIPEAAHQLAVMYEYGLVEQSHDANGGATLQASLLKAAELYEKAARGGLIESIYHLALMHAYGRGVPQDYIIATSLFQRAASNQQRPHAPSMRYLAIIYANGYSHFSGVPDYDAALDWYVRCIKTEGYQDVQALCSSEHKALSDVMNSARRKS